jgi:hypothetical protein
MTIDEKVDKLMGLVPEMIRDHARGWFEHPEQELDDLTNGHPLRIKIVQAVKNINSGVVDSPLWKALE